LNARISWDESKLVKLVELGKTDKYEGSRKHPRKLTPYEHF